MERLHMLGTGHAMTLDCYNTCFTLENSTGAHILVDTGGGAQILKQLKRADIDFPSIRHIILSHKHTDHLLGLFWLMRYCPKFFKDGSYEGQLHIYMHRELEQIVRTILSAVLNQSILSLIDDKILFHIVEDGEERQLLGYTVKFLDIHAQGDRQFGFKTTLDNGKTFVFLGDETFHEPLREEVTRAHWLLHEAMCLESEAEKFHPGQKGHASVKTAAEIAQSLKVQNLLLYHASDNDLANRKRLYTEEATRYFTGNVYVPDDLDVIDL